MIRALALALALAAPGAALAQEPGLPESGAEILWDEWGVPHIYAADLVPLMRAFGRAQAAAHGDLVLSLYAESRGRAAEQRGPEMAESDRRIRTLGIPELAAEWHVAQSAEARAWLAAFAEGFNDYAAEHPEAIDDALEGVLPVTGADPLAHVLRVVHFGFVAAPWDAAGAGSTLGSNAWAIAPSRSESGNALLLANPHLPWDGPFTWFEAHLVAPGLDASGAALVGMPFLGIAFNDRLGWSHTVNPIDAADLYALELVDGGYRWDGAVRPFETRVDSIRVRQDDGGLLSEPLVVRRSVHGPVIGADAETVFALRVAGTDQPGVLEQYLDMARAGSLEAFEAALSRLQMPFFNVVYADADGRVLYVFNGRVPERPTGDWSFWTQPVPGSDPSLVWDSVHPYADLPRVLDPPAGWVQNANDPPWTSTWPPALEPEGFPPYLTTFGVGFRAQRSIDLLSSADRMSFDELVERKHSTRLGLADRLLDDLLPLARESDLPGVPEAAAILAAWDRTADADSRGGPLFVAWVTELAARFGSLGRSFARPWDPADPLATPDGLADPAHALDALAEAAWNVETLWGAPDVAWGEVYRLRRDSLDLPANGASDPAGSFRVTDYDRELDGRLRAVSGDSYVAVVEFGEAVRAEGLLTYGNWSRAGSAHRTDQLPLYAEKRLRPIWRERAEVEAHTERRETVP
ncbi:MAG TPA: acylase [Gemmatimonadota bacterium]|nr:acylase [Gemmatimonadota bacterium]